MQRMNRPLFSCASLAAVAVISTACVSDPVVREFERELARQRQLESRAVAILRNSQDADALAAAAVFTAMANPADAMELLLRAESIAPTRPELVQLRAQICAELADCDPEPAEMKLRALAPNNGIGWLGAVARAHKKDDQAGLDAALEALARADHIWFHYLLLTTRLTDATMNAKALPAVDAVFVVSYGVVGNGMPTFVELVESCRDEALQRPGRRETCGAIAERLMASDTILSEMFGVAIARRVWSIDSEKGRAASEARRAFTYRSRKHGELGYFDDWDEVAAGRYLALLKRCASEQEVINAQLVDAGVDLMPPADWPDDKLVPETSQ